MRSHDYAVIVRNFSHNSTTSGGEPSWGSVEKTKLPRQAFADQGEAGTKSSWSYPHHWVQNGSGENEDGIYTTGTLQLHEGGLNAAWAAANGARSGEEASAAVKAHLQTHRSALGLDTDGKDHMIPPHARGEPKKWYNFTPPPDGQANDPVEIGIYEDIGEGYWGGGISAKQFIEDLKPYARRDLSVHINSSGGNVFEGLAIFNALQRHQAKVHITVDGFAVSTASFIALAGDTLTMPENTMMMIHEPWSAVVGNAAEMLKQADTLRKISNNLVDIYARNSSLSKNKIADMMAQETWLTAADCQKYGFCKEVTPGMRVAAHFDFSRYRNVPKSVTDYRPNFYHAQQTIARLHERAAQFRKGA